MTEIPDWLRRTCTLEVATLDMTDTEVAELVDRLHRGWVAADRTHVEALHNVGAECPNAVERGSCPIGQMAFEVFSLWSDTHTDLWAMRRWPDLVAALPAA